MTEARILFGQIAGFSGDLGRRFCVRFEKKARGSAPFSRVSWLLWAFCGLFRLGGLAFFELRPGAAVNRQFVRERIQPGRDSLQHETSLEGSSPFLAAEGPGPSISRLGACPFSVLSGAGELVERVRLLLSIVANRGQGVYGTHRSHGAEKLRFSPKSPNQLVGQIKNVSYNL